MRNFADHVLRTAPLIETPVVGRAICSTKERRMTVEADYCDE